MRPILFYTVGYPGAGKTTLATRLCSWLKIEHLRGDKIGIELFRFPTYSPQERATVYNEMNRRAAIHLAAGRHVLYDAQNSTHAQRAQLLELARRNGGEAVGLWLQLPIEVAKRRAGTARTDGGLAGSVVRVLPPYVFDQYVAAFEAPNHQEHVCVVSGEEPYFLQYHRLRRQLRRNDLPKLVQ